jgi:hypothetical protein
MILGSYVLTLKGFGMKTSCMLFEQTTINWLETEDISLDLGHLIHLIFCFFMRNITPKMSYESTRINF